MNHSKDLPFIHLFQTPLGYYFFDVNTGQIVKVQKDTYEFLYDVNLNIDTDDLREDIKRLYNQGFLKSNRVQNVEHPYTELLPYALNTKVHILILQLTQNCNLRCEYCLYSGNYNTRYHQNKKMSLKTAKSAIDFLKTHSTEKEKVYIAFYGGEPLLEFELIKESVAYAESILSDKEIEYSMTTNGTLLREEIMDFIVKYQFRITVSIDGPKEVHDRNRHFAESDMGSFDTIMENLHIFCDKYPEFYESNVRFNTVLSTEYSFSCSDSYFKEDELFKDSIFSLSGISKSFSKNKTLISEEYVLEEQYELFKLFLSLFGRIRKENVSILLREYMHHLIYFSQKIISGERIELPNTWHRSGPCIPGIVRLFVNADGDFYPCEKVSELAEICKIGNLENGFERKKIETLLNVEKLTCEECRNCWAYTECTTCIRYCDNCEENNKKNILNACDGVRNSVEETLKDYTVLKELGYDFSGADIETPMLPTERFELETPVIMIGNLLVGMEEISFEVACLMKAQFQKIGYCANILQGEELVDERLSITKNILKINNQAKKYEMNHKSDLIIITIPGNCIEISNKFCGDSGTYFYMFSHSIAPDYTVINIPYSSQFIQGSDAICSQIEEMTGIKADSINIVPKYLDIEVSEEEGRLDFLTLSSDFIQDKKLIRDNLFCAEDKEDLKRLTAHVIEVLSSYAENNVIDYEDNVNLDNENIEEIIKNIFVKLGLEKCIADSRKNEPLFGSNLQIRARDLLVVFFEIEKRFNILIKEEDINNHKFASYSSLVDCVQKYIL